MSVATFRLRRIVYRAHHPRWAFEPDSGAGAMRFGGRFNPAGVPALYTSLRMETAWKEAQQGFAFKPQPLTLCAYEVDCFDMVDLTDHKTREALDVNPADLACPWEDLQDRGIQPPTWSLAERLIGMGVAGIVTASFAAGSTSHDYNAIFWDWSENLPHQFNVVDDEGRL